MPILEWICFYDISIKFVTLEEKKCLQYEINFYKLLICQWILICQWKSKEAP
jgi:hypothetical protein